MRHEIVDPRAVTSLAILRVNWDEEGRDYLENFSPFLVEALRASEDDRVSLPEGATRLRHLVGFDLPQGGVKTLLRRAASRKLVTRENNVFYIRREALPAEALAKREGDLRRECEALVTKLQAYVREAHGVEWGMAEAETALLTLVESFAAPLLHAARKGDRPAPAFAADQKDLYLAAAFVENAYDRDPTAFAYLESVGTGAILASAIYYEDPSAVTERFNAVTAYLDTPLVLDALGVNGEQVRAPIVEMLELLRGQGAGVRMLKRTFDETQGVLDAYGGRTGGRRYEVGRGPIRGTMSPSDARMLSATLEDRLREFSVRVVDRPPFEHRYAINERELEDRLQEAIDYINPGARVHDVEALVTVHALRKGHRPSRLERAEAVFVTTNTTLTRAAHAFFCAEYGRETARAPVCVTADDLATRLWLKTPNQAPHLPKRQLLARAYAALQPSQGLVDKYLAEAERLRVAGVVSTRDYLHMRSSDDLLRRVTEATLNDPEAFTEGTIGQIRAREMEAVQEAAAARVERAEAARVEAERVLADIRADAEASREQAAEEASRRQAGDAELELARGREGKALEERDRLRMAIEKQQRRIDTIAQFIGRAVRYIMLCLAATLIISGVLLTIPGLPQHLSGGWRTVSLVAVGALVCASLASTLLDVNGWTAAPGRWAERGARWILTRMLLPPEG